MSIQDLQPVEFDPEPIFQAQMKSKTAESDTPKTTDKEKKPSKSETTTTEDDKEKSENSRTKPLEPFKPSEEIAAEQAVDFPVDI